MRNKTGSDTQPKIIRSKQQHATQTELWTLGTHDTIDGQITGLIQEISVEMEYTIEHIIKGKIISAHPDGHCLFRALGKNHCINPGEVIKYMKNKCIQMMDKKQKMYIESNDDWYKKMATKTKKWTDLKSNAVSQCGVSQWGGINETQLWAMITKQKVIILDSKFNTATIFHPNGDKLTDRVNLENVNQLHTTEIRQNKNPQYVLYNGIDHYNSITTNETIINTTKTQTNNSQKRNSRPIIKSKRRIEQKRNKRKIISNQDNDGKAKITKRHNICVVENGKITNNTSSLGVEH